MCPPFTDFEAPYRCFINTINQFVESLTWMRIHSWCSERIKSASVLITKTCLYYFDPLKPHFNNRKTGVHRVYIIFLIFAPKHRLWVLVRTASPKRFKRVPTIYVLSRIMKNIRVFLSELFQFLEVKFSIYLYWWVFVMWHRPFRERDARVCPTYARLGKCQLIELANQARRRNFPVISPLRIWPYDKAHHSVVTWRYDCMCDNDLLAVSHDIQSSSHSNQVRSAILSNAAHTMILPPPHWSRWTSYAVS